MKDLHYNFEIKMPLEEFQVIDVPPVYQAICNNVPKLMIIAGPNGVGKSTMLEAISKMTKGQFLGKSSGKIIGEPKGVYIPPHRAPVPFAFHKSYPHTIPKIRFLDSMASDSDSFDSPIQRPPDLIRVGRQRTRNAPDFSPYFRVKTRTATFAFEAKEIVGDVYEKFGEVKKDTIPDIFEPLRTTVEFLLPGIKFDQVKVEGDFYFVNFINRNGIVVEFDTLSSGEKDCLSMLFPLIEKRIENLISKTKGEIPPNDDLIMLIDSTEAFLHASLQVIFLQFIRKAIKEAKTQGENLQFIMVTHSPIIIDDALPDELFLMSFHNEGIGNQLLRTSELEINELHSYLGKLGLSNFTTGKSLLLLEGKDDVDVLSLLFPNIQRDFVLNYLEGKRKIVNFLNSLEKVRPELNSRGIRIYGILDQDRETAVKSQSVEIRKSIFTLPVTCMENYLLDSESIYESLKVLVGSEKLETMNIKSLNDIDQLKNTIINEPAYTTEDLKKRINESLTIHVNVDDLNIINEGAVNSRIDEISNQKKSRVAMILKEQGDIVKKHIQTKNFEKLDGKIIMKKIGQRFDKTYDEVNRAVAEQLNKLDKVPKGLTDIITNIKELNTKHN